MMQPKYQKRLNDSEPHRAEVRYDEKTGILHIHFLDDFSPKLGKMIVKRAGKGGQPMQTGNVQYDMYAGYILANMRFPLADKAREEIRQ